jgi:hypothetical protein
MRKMKTDKSILEQKLQKGDLVGAIDSVLKDVEETKSMAQEAVRSLNERAKQLSVQAETVLTKYPLL